MNSKRYTDTMGDPLQHIRFTGRSAPKINPSGRRAGTNTAHPASRPDPFMAWVLERAGLNAADYRGEPLQRRLAPCLRALHAQSEAHARQILEERPALLPVAISTLLIGVTDFFRDAPVFDTLRTGVLPKLPTRDRPLRAWSAGCSNGAELYSLAILLAEADRLAGSFLLGSDCRKDAIEQAQAARYNSGELRNIKAPDRARHFDRIDGAWRPVVSLRRHMHWKVADVGRCVEQGPWDLILWRNMAIYLQAEAAGSVWRGLVSVLAPEGVLVVGKAERPPERLGLVSVRSCIYRLSRPVATPLPAPG